MVVKFWGVRGSIPTPERRNSRYGGNTACIEIRLANGTLIILDCGSGLRALGKSLLREFRTRPIQAYIFLTHFHWDHVQGIPFFLPLYKKDCSILFHSILSNGQHLKEAIEGQWVSPYFPVEASLIPAVRHFYELGERPINLNGAIITSAPMNHPQGCVGYRIEADGAVFVLATDTEPGSVKHDQALRELARDADVLVYDAQYTPEQLREQKKGWGHSSWLEGTRVARDSGSKRLILFHHDPDSDDNIVDGLIARAREEFSNVVGSAEGLELDLPQGHEKRKFSVAASERRYDRRLPVSVPVLVRWVRPDGVLMQASAWVRNASTSGLYFVAPSQIRTDQPLELKMDLSGATPHSQATPLHFIAQAMHYERVGDQKGFKNMVVGVGVRRVSPGGLDLAACWKSEFGSRDELSLPAS